MAVSNQFWPVTAQVVPVLALAIVVEARATMQRWDENIPRWVRSFQGTLWGATLVLFAVTEIIAFSVLAGLAVETSAVPLAIIAIAASITVLIAAPASDFLVRSNAWALASGIGQIIIVRPRWKMLRAAVTLRWHLRKQRLSRKRLPEVIKKFDAVEQRVLTLPEGDEREKLLADIAENRQTAVGTLDRAARIQQLLTDYRTLLRDTGKEVRGVKAEVVAAVEREIATGEFKSLNDVASRRVDGTGALIKRLNELSALTDELAKELPEERRG